jgi:hypothetical protein
MEYNCPEGTTQIKFEDWVKTLSQADQDVITSLNDKVQNLRQIEIDEGRLTIVNRAYVWINEIARHNFNQISDVEQMLLLSYFQRFQVETDAQITATVIEE